MVRTIFCFAYVVVSMVIVTPFGIIAALVGFLGLRKPMSFVLQCIETLWAWLVIKVVGSKVTVSGKENVPLKGGVCFVSNHGSIFDIALLLAFSGRMIGFIAKKELAFIPVLNLWIYLIGGQFIDRNSPRKAMKTINKGIESLKAGNAMIIFPEGSRSRGQGLLPFRPGAFKLATQADAVVVPVALAGTYGIFEKKYRVDTTEPVKITFCKPVNTAAIPPADRKKALSDHIYAVIREELEKE